MGAETWCSPPAPNSSCSSSRTWPTRKPCAAGRPWKRSANSAASTSRTTISTHIKTLEAAGLITVKRRKKEVSIYTLVMDADHDRHTAAPENGKDVLGSNIERSKSERSKSERSNIGGSRSKSERQTAVDVQNLNTQQVIGVTGNKQVRGIRTRAHTRTRAIGPGPEIVTKLFNATCPNLPPVRSTPPLLVSEIFKRSKDTFDSQEAWTAYFEDRGQNPPSSTAAAKTPGEPPSTGSSNPATSRRS